MFSRLRKQVLQMLHLSKKALQQCPFATIGHGYLQTENSKRNRSTYHGEVNIAGIQLQVHHAINSSLTVQVEVLAHLRLHLCQSNKSLDKNDTQFYTSSVKTEPPPTKERGTIPLPSTAALNNGQKGCRHDWQLLLATGNSLLQQGAS